MNMKDRAGERWRRTDNGEDVTVVVKKSQKMCTLFRGFVQFAFEGIPYERWKHFVRVETSTMGPVHRTWKEDSDVPWERYLQKVT